MFWRSSENLELVDCNRFDYYRENCGPLGIDQTPGNIEWNYLTVCKNESNKQQQGPRQVWSGNSLNWIRMLSLRFKKISPFSN